MTRWKPDSRRRMQDAALELFDSKGYADTTAAAVAERAGVTERTFYRHFEDKKEVLFDSDQGRSALVEAIVASTSATTLEIAADGIRAVARIFQEDQERLRKRAAVITATPELQERERTKSADWTTAIAEALVFVGVGRDPAQVAAATTTAIFSVAFDQWISGADAGDHETSSLETVINQNLSALRSVVDPAPRA